MLAPTGKAPIWVMASLSSVDRIYLSAPAISSALQVACDAVVILSLNGRQPRDAIEP